MTLDLTKPVRTRDGKKARVVCTDVAGGYCKVLALVMQENKQELPYTYRQDGLYFNSGTANSSLDLVNGPEVREEFRNLTDVELCGPSDTLEEAIERSDRDSYGTLVAVIGYRYEDDHLKAWSVVHTYSNVERGL